MEWHIPVMQPNSDKPNPPALVNCKIMEIPGGYLFIGPHGNPRSTAAPGNPMDPLEFPMFQARLNGPIVENWFITVMSFGELPWGYWSNSRFHHGHPGDGDDEPDTWVAHAGATVDKDEGKDAAAASASSTAY